MRGRLSYYFPSEVMVACYDITWYRAVLSSYQNKTIMFRKSHFTLHLKKNRVKASYSYRVLEK